MSCARRVAIPDGYRTLTPQRFRTARPAALASTLLLSLGWMTLSVGVLASSQRVH
jgi:hypothetical protein